MIILQLNKREGINAETMLGQKAEADAWELEQHWTALTRGVILLALWVIYGQTLRLHLLDLFTLLERIMYSWVVNLSWVSSYRTAYCETKYRKITAAEGLCFEPWLYFCSYCWTLLDFWELVKTFFLLSSLLRIKKEKKV